MSSRVNAIRLLAVFALAAVLLMGVSIKAQAPDQAQGPAKVTDKLAEALRAYNEARLEDGVKIARSQLDRTDLEPADSIAIYEVLSLITYAQGQEYFNKAFSYLDRIANIGPCVRHLPQEIWPQQLRDRWFHLMTQKGTLSCPENQGITTIAIMEFDNFSVGKYQEELGYLAKGLADFFELDFSKISSLRVVERDKINAVLKELELTESGKVDPGTAVKVGKLLGAQLMVFGSIVQLDDKNARMAVKVVKTETSEIITSVDKEGKPDYIKMEKELVGELAEKLDLKLTGDVKDMIKESATESMDAATLYSKGLYYQDKYDYEQAYAFFKKAYEADPNFEEAKRKMEIYRPLAAS